MLAALLINFSIVIAGRVSVVLAQVSPFPARVERFTARVSAVPARDSTYIARVSSNGHPIQIKNLNYYSFQSYTRSLKILRHKFSFCMLLSIARLKFPLNKMFQ